MGVHKCSLLPVELLKRDVVVLLASQQQYVLPDQMPYSFHGVLGQVLVKRERRFGTSDIHALRDGPIQQATPFPQSRDERVRHWPGMGPDEELEQLSERRWHGVRHDRKAIVAHIVGDHLLDTRLKSGSP